MKNIIIIGNSGAARECYWVLQEVFANNTWENHSIFMGFLSWKAYQGDLKELSHFYLGDCDTHEVSSENCYIIGIANPHIRQQIFKELSAKNANFMNLVHPSVYICPSARLGQANVLQRGSTVYCNAQLGNGNYLNGAVNLAHDAAVGDFNLLGPYCMVLGNATMGSHNQLAPYCVLLNNTKIGHNNILAPNSFIYKGCKDNCRMAGNPALKIGEVDTTLQGNTHEA